MAKIRVAIIGYGYWGPNLVRNIMLNSNYELIAIVDQDEKRREQVGSTLSVNTFASHEEVVEFNLELDLVVICTRPSSHKQIAMHFIKNQINVLITKPCGTSSIEALEIATYAEEMGVLALCDYTYHFSPLIDFLLMNQTANQIVNEMIEYTSYRTALGIVQSDVDVIADLAVHDFYILLLLKQKLPQLVNCLNTSSTNQGQLKSAFLTLRWDDDFMASIHVSWNSPKKVRLISIASRDHAVVLEEMNREAPIQLIHFEPENLGYLELTPQDKIVRNISYAMGNLEVPQIEMYEALAKEIDMVAMALKKKVNSTLIPSAKDASNIWKIVEALRLSQEMGGLAQNVK